MSDASTSSSGSGRGPRWLLPTVAAVAILALVGGLIVVGVGGGDDDDSTDTTEPVTPTGPTTSSTPATVAPDTTSTTTSGTTTSSTTSTTTSTTTPATSSSTTVPEPTFALPEPGAPDWTVTLEFVGEPRDLTMGLVPTSARIDVYDGAVDGFRCIAAIAADREFSAWCGSDGQPARFVVQLGIDTYLLESDGAVGQVGTTAVDPAFPLPYNGCSATTASVLAAARLAPFASVGLACTERAALVTIAPLWFGDRPAPDGGDILLTSGDEGWDVADFGTGLGCGSYGGIDDVCEHFGVESELHDARLPYPPGTIGGAPTPDFIEVTDTTATLRELIGDETDPATIDQRIVEHLVDPDAEPIPVVQRATGEAGGTLDLLVVDIGQADDSILLESWSVWIGADPAGTRAPIVRATSWLTCARGVSDGLCV